MLATPVKHFFETTEAYFFPCFVFDPCLSASGQEKMYDVVMETIEQDLPSFKGNIFTYATNPGLIMPAVLLMVYVSKKVFYFNFSF